MLKITDKKFFGEIIADAVAQAHLKYADENLRNRWINAFAKASAVILEGDTTSLYFDPQTKILYHWSPESNEIYQSGETCCGCPAFNQPNSLPCDHRAMSHLIKNYFEFQQKTDELAKIDFADAVFFDEELPAKRKVELLNICILEGRAELIPRVEALLKECLERKNQ